MHDVIIRNATIVDGTGRDGFVADIAVRDGAIAEIGAALTAESRESIDATGRIVTPGFVDVHTHFDGQVTWDSVLEPVSNHGVTTVVMGNCGVGFAPVRPGAQQALIDLMEGVEDIPGAALAEGMQIRWESFPSYLDVLDRRRWSVDVATQLPHGALRAYVMGATAAEKRPATAEQISEMAALTRAAIEAGAYGFTTSRTVGHRALDGTPVPGTFAGEDELFAIGNAVAAAGGGVLEFAAAGLATRDRPEPWPPSSNGSAASPRRLRSRPRSSSCSAMMHPTAGGPRWRVPHSGGQTVPT
jgi:N-acyl-D-aspartate/D-glutamate deacylase